MSKFDHACPRVVRHPFRDDSSAGEVVSDALPRAKTSHPLQDVFLVVISGEPVIVEGSVCASGLRAACSLSIVLQCEFESHLPVNHYPHRP